MLNCCKSTGDGKHGARFITQLCLL